MHRAAILREPLEPSHPGFEVGAPVLVGVALRVVDVVALPQVGVATTETDDREVRRDGPDRRHRAGETLRLVDAHQREPVLLEVLQCGIAMTRVEPLRVAKLDGERKVAGPVTEVHQIVE